MEKLNSVDWNSLAPCYYATEQAFFNLGGIMNNDDSSTQQVKTFIQSDWGLEINFCEDALPASEYSGITCNDENSFAYIYETSKGKCEGLKAPDSDSANTVAVQINDPENPSNITGIALYYMSTDYQLWVNITCDKD